MPILQKIVIQDFRNIVMQEMTFSRNINCISGNNGEGKTNLLDAIHYLSMTKSVNGPSDRFNFRHGTKSFSIGGTYEMPSGQISKISIKVSEGADKKLVKDDKTFSKVSDYIGTIPVVMVSPSDTSLVSESGEDRRRFINSVLSQMDRNYLSDVQKYNKLLLQRNAALKADNPDESLLEALDSGMAIFAAHIYERRKAFVEDLVPAVQEHYTRLSGGREIVGIRYSSDLEKTDMFSLLAQSRGKDLALRYTSAGPHRDDFIFEMDGHPIRRCGSQGQQKSFLVSLKFAQYDIMKRNSGHAPILLLDDLFDKLDMDRTSNLLRMVSGNDFGQIFITDSNKVRLEGIIDGITQERKYLETAGGVFTECE